MAEQIRDRGITERPPTALRQDASRSLRRSPGPGLPEATRTRPEARAASTRAGLGAEARRESTTLSSRRAESRAESRSDNANRPPRSRVTPDDNGRVIDIFA